MLKKPLITVALILALASCRPFSTLMVDPQGPPEYQLGWEDGCDTGISAEGAWYNKAVFGFKKRTELAANDQYKQGWNEGFTYCRFAQAGADEAGQFEHIGLGSGFGD
ncbi:MAG: hypothetical protein AB7L92_04465 [Alphaproteobacteria bacterium]